MWSTREEMSHYLFDISVTTGIWTCVALTNATAVTGSALITPEWVFRGLRDELN